MFGRSLTLFSVFGIKIKVNIGWALIAAFIAWSLAQGFFPQLYKGLDPTAYWWMALAAILGLAASIVLHELAHSLVARAFGLPLHSITLFMFGGVAELEEEPHSPLAEFLMAIAGPAMSVVLAFGFRGTADAMGGVEAHPATAGVLSYLGLLNFVLAVFNMIPAFPMDGGRALRAAIWGVRKDFRAATRIAARIGAWFGIALMLLGLLGAVSGNFVGGLWWVLIGMFIRAGAEGAAFQEEATETLAGHSVRDFMTADPDFVTPELDLARFVEEHVYRFHHDAFPVAREGRALGLISLRETKAVPRERWAGTTVGQVAASASEANTIEASADSMEAFKKMQQGRQSRLLVVDGDRLVGVLSLKDLLEPISLHVRLES